MTADERVVERLFSEASRLAPEQRLRLIQKILQTLVPWSPAAEPQPLRFGEFTGDAASMSTWADFSIAEWRPPDDDLDGA